MVKKVIKSINPVAKAMLQKRQSPMVIPNKKKKKPEKVRLNLPLDSQS